jgi:hypothetical protein
VAFAGEAGCDIAVGGVKVIADSSEGSGSKSNQHHGGSERCICVIIGCLTMLLVTSHWTGLSSEEKADSLDPRYARQS